MTTERELFVSAYGVAYDPQTAALQAQLDIIARELVTVRELAELLVDWAGARDRIPADEPDGEP